MELSSTRTTSSVTGGSTLTAPLLRTSTVSMMRLLLREMLLLVPLIRLSMVLPSMSTLLLLEYESYDDYSLGGYEEATTVAAVEEYLPPAGDARRGRRLGGSRRRPSGRRGSRRNQRRPSGRRSFRG